MSPVQMCNNSTGCTVVNKSSKKKFFFRRTLPTLLIWYTSFDIAGMNVRTAFLTLFLCGLVYGLLCRTRITSDMSQMASNATASLSFIHRPLTPISTDALHVRESQTAKVSQEQSGRVSSTIKTFYHPPWYHDIKNMDNPFTSTKPCTRDINYKSMAEAVAANASPDKVIILPSTVDGGYQHMALNYYEFNLHRLNITNFVFMCIDKEACDVLRNFCIPAYLFAKVAHGDKAFKFQDQQFVDKATTKLRIAQSALKLGYHVLLTDLDIVFLKNPFNHFPCDACDVQIQTNRPESEKRQGFYQLNSGFIYIRKSPAITEAFGEMVRRHDKNPKLHDQNIVNEVLIENMKAKKLKVVNLPYNTWPVGMAYFGVERSEKRDFYDLSKPDDNVIVIHSNWMVGIVPKIYRLKEHLMWVVDYNRYYSDPQRNYIMYENPAKNGKTMEKSALSSAFGIASVLNRTVILPRFDEGTKPLSKFMNIHTFEKTYHGLYRENSFLANPRTPDDVISSITPQLLIDSKAAVDLKLLNITGDVQHFRPADPAKGVTCQELKEWFQPFSDVRVLRFHSLYGAFHGFDVKKRSVNCSSK